MKRPVTLVLVASLLLSATAFADSGNSKHVGKQVAGKIVRAEAKQNHHRGHDNRHHDSRGNNHRGNDGRDRGNSGGHDRRDDRNDYRNDNRHDWNDRRNDHNRNDHNRNDRNRHDSHNNNWNGNRGWDRHRNDWNKHPHYWDNRRHDRRDYARYRYHFGHYRAPHGYHYRTWHRGDYLPRAYYGSSYVVYDWRPYRLYAPPYGYHWVRVGNDVLLTALATGVVLDVLYNIWY
ncbi:MAG TPA: RcnB family protein [Steroidobacteraceae bacterium]|nr:RcnB family protein [Steroidobacteraceae bacterium]